MIRTTAVPRPVRVGAAAVGVAGILALAGCAATAADADESRTTDDSAATEDTAADDSADASTQAGSYRDGTYTAEGSYRTPESIETITVTVTLEDDVITAVDVVGNPTKRESQQYQGQFIGGIADVVVGKDIDEISVSRVAGSSLTSGGFTQAIDEIKSEAAG